MTKRSSQAAKFENEDSSPIKRARCAKKDDDSILSVLFSGDAKAIKTYMVQNKDMLENVFYSEDEYEERIGRPLAIVANQGHFEATFVLVRLGANIHADDDHALREAISNQHDEIVYFLVQLGANVRAFFDSPVYWAAKHDNLEILQLLTTHQDASPEMFDDALYSACEFGSIGTVQYIFDKKMHLCPEIDTKGALRKAIINKHFEIVSLMLKYISIKDDVLSPAYKDHRPEPNTLLVCAIAFGTNEILCLLLDHGADIHAEDDCAFRYAMGFERKQRHEMAKILLDRGANIHAKDNLVFRQACRNGNEEAVCFLLQHGADVHANNDEGIQEAIMCGHESVARILLQHGARPQISEAIALEWIKTHTDTQVADVLVKWFTSQTQILSPSLEIGDSKEKK